MDSASNDKGHRFFINYIVSQMDISVCFERAAHNFAMYDTDSYNAKFPIEKAAAPDSAGYPPFFIPDFPIFHVIIQVINDNAL